MEKLGQLAATGEWDLIVVDTPPSRSALDFLDAPQRMSTFLDGRMIRLLSSPGPGGRAEPAQGRSAPGSRCSPRPSRRSSAASCSPTRRRSCRPSTRCSAASGNGPPPPTRCCASPGTAFVVVAAPGAGRAARGRLLRRPAAHRGHAAGRAGAQPHPPGARPAVRRRRARDAADELPRRPAGRGRAAPARRPGGPRGPGGPAARPLLPRPPRCAR